MVKQDSVIALQNRNLPYFKFYFNVYSLSAALNYLPDVCAFDTLVLKPTYGNDEIYYEEHTNAFNNTKQRILICSFSLIKSPHYFLKCIMRQVFTLPQSVKSLKFFSHKFWHSLFTNVVNHLVENNLNINSVKVGRHEHLHVDLCDLQVKMLKFGRTVDFGVEEETL